MDYRDLKNSIDTAREEGRKEGREEGEKKKAIEVAKKVKKKGYSFQDISEMTGLTIDEIEEL